MAKEKLTQIDLVKEYVILNYFDAVDILSVLKTTLVHLCKIDGSYHPFHIVKHGKKTFLSVAGYDFKQINAFFHFWLNNEFTKKAVFDDTLEHDLIKFKKHCKSDNAVMYCCGNNTYNFFDLNEIKK